ncbi:phage tail length tape measure family protein [Stenotrophomonas maltophilia group sp. P373]|nr:hypothetical protein C7E13_00960 [Stenotrophomonas maltophilia]
MAAGWEEAFRQQIESGRLAPENVEGTWAATADDRTRHTVSAFDSIAKEPVEGLLKLNDAERFLTAAQLQRIVR